MLRKSATALMILILISLPMLYVTPNSTLSQTAQTATTVTTQRAGGTNYTVSLLTNQNFTGSKTGWNYEEWGNNPSYAYGDYYTGDYVGSTPGSVYLRLSSSSAYALQCELGMTQQFTYSGTTPVLYAGLSFRWRCNSYTYAGSTNYVEIYMECPKGSSNWVLITHKHFYSTTAWKLETVDISSYLNNYGPGTYQFEADAYLTTSGSGAPYVRVLYDDVGISVGYNVPSPPTGLSVTINNDAAYTNNRRVSLTLAAIGAETMQFSNFSTGPWTSAEPFATTKQVSLTLGDGVKNIYFMANNTYGGTGPVSDSITYDSSAPPAPTLQSPTNGTAINNNAPTFSWFAVTDPGSGLASYTLDYSTDKNFATFTTVSVPSGTTSYTPSSLADGTWYWRVKAIDNAGNSGPYTATNWFVVIDTAYPPGPTLTSPVTGSFTKTRSVTFVWSQSQPDPPPSSGIAGYTLQYSLDPNFISGVTTVSSITGTSYPTTLSSDGTWYWRVRATDKAGNTGSYSSSSSVIVDTVAPNAPALSSPSTGTKTNVNTPTFTWSAAADPSPSSGVASYALQLDTSSSFNSGSLRTITGITGTSYTATSALTDGTWYWRVNATDNAGNKGSYSSYRSIIVDTVVPGQPSLSSPGNGAVTNDNTPTFTWVNATDQSPSSGMASHTLQYSKDQTFATGVTTVTGLASSYTVPGGSPLSDGTWYWRVRAVDFAGNTGSWSATNYVIIVDTVVPGAPALSSPATGIATNNNRPTFTWSAAVDPAPSSGIASYTLQLDTSTSFNSGNLRTITGVTGTSYTPPVGSPLSDGTWYWRVSAVDNAGNPGSYSSYWTIVIDTVAPNSPSLGSPANGTYTNVNAPTFTWSAATDPSPSSGIASYTLQLDTSPSFNSGNLRTITGVTGTSYTATSALTDGTWYWHVRTVDNAGNLGSYSSYWTIVVDTVAPGMPALLSPGDGAGTNVNTPTFTWSVATDPSPSSGIASYTLQLDTSPSFNTGNLRTITGLTSTSYTVTSPLADGTWYWHVRASDNAGNAGSYAAHRSIVIDTIIPGAPTLLTPANGLITKNNTQTFSWSNVGATTYDFYIDRSPDFNTADLTIYYGLTNFSKVMRSLLDGNWYWKVIAQRIGGSNSSTIWGFFVDTATPNQPTLTSPSTGTNTNDNTPTFTWIAATDPSPSSGIASYALQVDTSTSFNSGNLRTITGLTATSYTVLGGSPLSDGTWYWRVNATDKAGNKGVYSSYWTIVVDTVAPGQPTLLSPSDGASTNVNRPALTWIAATDPSPSSGIARYTLQVDTSTSFNSGNLRTITGITGTSYTVTSPLADGTWYWRVRATDNAGNTGSYSSYRSLVVDTASPGLPTLASPLAGSATNDNTPTFTWSAAADPSPSSGITYTLQVDTSTSFNSGNLRTITGLTATSYTVPGGSPLSDGTWYWRVNATDNAGNKGAYTSYWRLVVDIVSPGQPTLSSPANGAKTNIALPSLVWNAATDTTSGVANYTVQLDTSPSFSSGNLRTITGITVTSYTVTGALTDGTWYWHVRAIDKAGNPSSYSGYWNLTVDTQPPTISNFSPSSGSYYTNSLTITLSITATDNLGSPQKMYLSNDGTNWVEFDYASSASWTLTAGDGVKHVYFKCRDAAGNWAYLAGGFINITLDTIPPIAGSPSDPAPGTITSDNTTTFQWSAGSDGGGSGVDWYGLQIDTTTTFNSPDMISRQVLTGTTYTLTFALNDGTWYWRVNATDRAGNTGQYSTYSMFILNAIPPGKVIDNQNRTPANYALSNTVSPRFNWDSTGAYRYHIQIDVASNFSTPYLIDNDTLYSNTFSPADDNGRTLTDGTWYWRIEAISIAGAHSGYSSVYQIQIITKPPNSPALLLPADLSATNVRNGTLFTWANVPSAASYWLQFDRLPTFDSGDVSGYTFANLTTTSYTYSKSLFDGRWYWHVFSLDSLGNINNSALVPVYQFIIDTNFPSWPALGNASGVFTNQPLPTLTWFTATDIPSGNPPVSSGIASYTLQLDTSSSFSSGNLRTITGLTSTTYTIPGGSPLSDGTWYWRVNATDRAGNTGPGNYPAPSFTVDTVAPAPPLISSMSPNGESLDTSKPTFTWGAPSDPSGIREYIIEIDTSNRFDSAERLEYYHIGGTTYTPGDELRNGQWYWRIVAVDGAGNTGTWSEAVPFAVSVTTGLSPMMILMIGGGSGGVVILGILGYVMYRRAKIPFVIKKIDQSIKLIGKGDMPQPVPMRTRAQLINALFETKLAIISRQKLDEAKAKKKSKETELGPETLAPTMAPKGAESQPKVGPEESDVDLIAKELEKLEGKDKSVDDSEMIKREIDELEKGSKRKKGEGE